MRIYDNASPQGRYVGEAGPGIYEPCCRDGFARGSLIRPLHYERPAPPTMTEAWRRQYKLCKPCLRARVSAGAHTGDMDNFSSHLAH